MAEAVPIQTSFNGGLFSSRLIGRSDIQRYQYACDELQNFIPTVQGPIVKRSGTRFVKSCILSDTRSRLIPFEVSTEQAYIIELGEGVMRFYRDSGAVLEASQSLTGSPTAANPVSVPVTGHGYSTGDSVYISGSAMTELNGRFFTITKVDNNNFELDDEDGTSRTTGSGGDVARHYSLLDGVSSDDIPWLEDELDAIKFVQNGDLMYLVHENHPPHEIVRTSDLAWSCTVFAPGSPAFETENTSDTEMSIDDPTVGAGRVITASAATFSASDVGRIFTIGEVLEAENGKWAAFQADADEIVRGADWDTGFMVYFEGRVYECQNRNAGGTGGSAPVHEEGTKSDGATGNTGDLAFWNWGYGVATITGYTSTTQVTVTVTTAFPKSAVTGGGTSTKWAFGAWDAVNGYPKAVSFYEDRLWFGGTTTEPQTFWGSASGQFENFRLQPADVDDTAVQFTLLSDKLNAIEWMQGEDALLIGTSGGEYTVDSGNAERAITPSNIRVRRRSVFGTESGVQPLFVDSSLVFVRRNHDVNELTFDFDTNRQVALDLTQFAHNILKPGVRQLSYQADPFRQLWVAKTDGTMATMTFVKAEDVIGWADVTVGGTAASVESVAVIPHPDGDENQVWVTVQRTIGGNTVRYVEYFEKPFDTDDALEDAFFVDSGATYSGAAATEITGLWHLEGETVRILSEGARLPDAVVANGAITIDVASTKVQAGLAMGSARARTVPWNSSPSTLSTTSSQGITGRISNFIVRVDRTGDALEYGGDFETMDKWERRTPGDPMDSPVPLFTGNSPFLDMPSGWVQDRQVALRHDEPTPCTILSIVGKLEVDVL